MIRLVEVQEYSIRWGLALVEAAVYKGDVVNVVVVVAAAAAKTCRFQSAIAPCRLITVLPIRRPIAAVERGTCANWSALAELYMEKNSCRSNIRPIAKIFRDAIATAATQPAQRRTVVTNVITNRFASEQTGDGRATVLCIHFDQAWTFHTECPARCERGRDAGWGGGERSHL
jgi:hypothetical protein